MIALLLANLAMIVLVVLLGAIFFKGSGAFSLSFFTRSYVENVPEESGVRQAIIGSLALCLICGLVALPVGIGTAIFMEEFKPKNRQLRFFHSLIQLNINNLAGVPSVVYGILGLTAFVYMFSMFRPIQVDSVPQFEIGAYYYYQVETLGDRRRDIEGQIVTFPCEDPTQQFFDINEPIEVTDGEGNQFMLNVIPKGEAKPRDSELLVKSVYEGKSGSRVRKKRFYHFHLPFSKSILSAGLALALVILPIVIIACQEAIRGVPDSLREASLGLGATRWQMVRATVLPAALPGIMTGAILAMSRAVGEAAPILVIMGAVKGANQGLTALTDKTDTMPVTIFSWARDSNNSFEDLSAAAIIVLLLFLLGMNSIAIFIRSRSEKKSVLA